MTARAFLIRGLLAGLLAGLATFFVAYQFGEPHVETAIALEEAASSTAAANEAGAAEHSDEEATAGHSHDEEEGTVVSRENQRTWGLLTGSLAMGLALGGLVALAAAATLGRLGRMTPGQSTALVSLLGFISVALVPFLKYPATPPAVGNGETIGHRTTLYFGFLIISVVAAALATFAAVKLRERTSTYTAVVAASAGYLIVMAVAAWAFPTVNEIGDFPADTLWFFRRASIITIATMWAVIGVVLTGLVRRLYADEVRAAERRELVDSM